MFGASLLFGAVLAAQVGADDAIPTLTRPVIDRKGAAVGLRFRGGHLELVRYPPVVLGIVWLCCLPSLQLGWEKRKNQQVEKMMPPA